MHYGDHLRSTEKTQGSKSWQWLGQLFPKAGHPSTPSRLSRNSFKILVKQKRSHSLQRELGSSSAIPSIFRTSLIRGRLGRKRDPVRIALLTHLSRGIEDYHNPGSGSRPYTVPLPRKVPREDEKSAPENGYFRRNFDRSPCFLLPGAIKCSKNLQIHLQFEWIID